MHFFFITNMVRAVCADSMWTPYGLRTDLWSPHGVRKDRWGTVKYSAQAPPATAPSPPPCPSGSGPLPHSSNATSDPAGLRRPVKKALFMRSCKRPLPSDTKSFATASSAAVALPQPSPPKKRKGAAAAQAGLVQMAKSFPSAPTAAIVHAQQVVSSAAIVAPSDLERVKARCKWSTTHGPSGKEVVVITSLPTHWPNKPVVGPLNSYLGTHGRAGGLLGPKLPCSGKGQHYTKCCPGDLQQNSCSPVSN
jgi:hypothetical protein